MQVIAVSFVGGTVERTSDRVPVTLGETVRLEITADVSDEVHVHGYHLLADVAPGHRASIEFTADEPGLYEVELEEAGMQLTQLLVS